MLFILFAFIGVTVGEVEKETAIPVGGDVSFVCVSDSIAMWAHKTEEGKDATLMAAGTSILPNVDSSRYSFSVKSTNYQMTIKSAKAEDAGIFICNNVFRFALVVIEAPTCAPTVNSVVEDNSYDFTCAAATHGTSAASGVVEWWLGGDAVSGVGGGADGDAVSAAAKSVVKSSFSYTVKYIDREKELRCVIEHPRWDLSFPKPSCSFGKLDVQFEPKLKCPSQLLFKPEEKQFLIKCEIFANPLPAVSSIKWEFGQGEESRLKITSFKTNADSIEATLKLTNHHLSVRKSNIDVTLKVPNPLKSGAAVAAGKDAAATAVVSKTISAGLIHGPVVSCPEKIEMKKKHKGLANVECRIFVNPIPPNSNISWYVDDDFIQRQRQDMIEKIPGGIVAKFQVQTENYGKDSLTAILKISGYQTVASDKVEILAGEMQRDEKVGRGGDAGEDGPFMEGNKGLLLLGGGTFFLMILTVIVAIVFYKKGFFSSNESQYGTRAVIAQGTMADSEFFGIADKGYDSGTFQFYQPKNTLDPHGTMTMKLMKRIKESERDSEWTEGFAKMANALYLKDTDQDGYLTVMEAKPVILSYSDIYHLGITENKLDDVFVQCSNGQHVDVETLLRMISLQ